MKKIIKYGECEEGSIKQAENCLVEAEAFCLMADNHEGTIKILHTLEPLIVCMAGEEDFDPYKD